MRGIAALFLVMGLVGCGTSWEGSYVGALTQSGTCSDGSMVPATSDAVTVKLTDDGDTVSWSAACGATATADIDGDTARVRQYSCPAETLSDGTVRNTTVNDGTLALDDTSLRMDLSLTVGLSGPITGSCSLKAKGTLDRLED